jgi:hypothetical protein
MTWCSSGEDAPARMASASRYGSRRVAAIFGSIPRREMPYRKFNLTVGELAPLFDGWRETAPRHLIDDFPGFAASRFKGKREQLLLLFARLLVCQVTRAN